jgi:hypothetical protein
VIVFTGAELLLAAELTGALVAAPLVAAVAVAAAGEPLEPLLLQAVAVVASAEMLRTVNATRALLSNLICFSPISIK